jgi:hypothetical protein
MTQRTNHNDNNTESGDNRSEDVLSVVVSPFVVCLEFGAWCLVFDRFGRPALGATPE